jgi:hypothetical protein
MELEIGHRILAPLTQLLLDELNQHPIQGEEKERIRELILGYDVIMGIPDLVLAYAKASDLNLDSFDDPDLSFVQAILLLMKEKDFS